MLKLMYCMGFRFLSDHALRIEDLAISTDGSVKQRLPYSAGVTASIYCKSATVTHLRVTASPAALKVVSFPTQSVCAYTKELYLNAGYLQYISLLLVVIYGVQGFIYSWFVIPSHRATP